MIRVALAAFILLAVLLLALVHREDFELGSGLEPAPTGEVTPSTVWPQTMPTLPSGFERLVTTTTTPKVKLKAPSRPVRVYATGELQDLIRAGFATFGPEVAEEAVRVAGCESTGDSTGTRLNPSAMNGAHYGLFQISRTYHEERVARLGFTWEQMTEPGPNIAAAVDIYAEQKWGPWTCKTAA